MSDAGTPKPGIRGLVELEVCGRSLAIAPTYNAIDSIEARLRCGLPELLQRAVRGEVRIREMTIIVQEGLRGAGFGGKDSAGDLFQVQEIGEDVLANFQRYAVAVGLFLGNAFGGPAEKKSEPSPQASAKRNPARR